MEMAVAALSNAVAVEQVQNLRAAVAPVQGRVMEKAEFLFLPRRFQRRFQPQNLPVVDLFIVGAAVVLLKNQPREPQRATSS